MSWIIAGIVVIGFIFYKFYSDMKKDDSDLNGVELSTKFSVLTKILNDSAFKGNAEIVKLNKREFNLYREKENKIIMFHYATGILSITWKYKYLQQEVVHKKIFREVRNLSSEDQEKLANTLIIEMAKIMESHQLKVGTLF